MGIKLNNYKEMVEHFTQAYPDPDAPFTGKYQNKFFNFYLCGRMILERKSRLQVWPHLKSVSKSIINTIIDYVD